MKPEKKMSKNCFEKEEWKSTTIHFNLAGTISF